MNRLLICTLLVLFNAAPTCTNNTLDPCGVTGTWTATCPGGESFTFSIPSQVAAFGGTFSDQLGNTFSFDPGECASVFIEFGPSTIGAMCPGAPLPEMFMEGDNPQLIEDGVDPSTCMDLGTLSCAITGGPSDRPACVQDWDACYLGLMGVGGQNCCHGTCVGQGQGINTVFLCVPAG